LKKYYPITGVLLFLILPVFSFAQIEQGFFLNDFKPKKVNIPLYKKIKTSSAQPEVRVVINLKDTMGMVSKYLFGNNTNQWMGQTVTEPLLVDQLKTLSPNILRYPGGNISNVFFWDATPDQFPKDLPDILLYGDKEKHGNQYYFAGKQSSPQAFSLDNYYEILKETGSVGSICVNAGYARYGTGEHPIETAAHYAADWVRYDRGRTRYWEIGNEDYGVWQAGYKIDTCKNKDGQPEINNGELYGHLFKVFRDSMKVAAKEAGFVIYIGATIIELPKNKISDNEVDKNWNSGFFKSARNTADFFILHSYYTPYQKDSNPEEILQSATAVTSRMAKYMNDMVQENNVIAKPIALTEWNIFAEGSKQQTSNIAGVHAAIVLGELIKNKFGMACRWNLANGYENGNDHGLFNKGDEPGMPKWSPRPVYYYMYYFQKYFGDRMIGSTSSDSNIIVYTSNFSDGKKGLIIINKSREVKTISIQFDDRKIKGRFYGYTLKGGNDNGLFSRKVVINDKETDLPAGGPADFQRIKAWSSRFKNEIKIDLTAMTVQFILIK